MYGTRSILCFENLPINTCSRFRWAVCQLDALQRLKCERSIVRNALATLPKTLDETYERILLRIPKEEWAFVRRAFCCMCFYLELYTDSLPCTILLEAIRRSTARANDYENDAFYDSDRLRELCGCLISISSEETVENLTSVAVSFAHYTVREYLASTRILESPTSFFATRMPTLIPECLEVVILEAGRVDLNDVRNLESCMDVYSDSWKAIEESFQSHCVASAILSLDKCHQEITMNNNLFKLAKVLLDPSKSHFDKLIMIVSIVSCEVEFVEFFTE